MPSWYPVLDHPSAGGLPWYSVDPHGEVRRAEGHPRGPAALATFRITNEIAYSTGYGTEGEAGVAWFEIIGSMVYRASGHPEGESTVPRYQVRG
jgi:hypothetical protein